MIKRTARQIQNATFYADLRRKDQTAGAQLTLRQDRTQRIRPSDILLVTCLRNEQPRMQAFVDHYRKIGVAHFLVIDNGSSDGFAEWAAGQDDISVWYTEASYRAAAFGMLWCNDLLRRYGTGHWCVCLDPDEMLVYPHMETRSLRALCQFLEDDKRVSMHTLTLDAYSDRPLAETVLHAGQSPFEACPYFDRDGYIQRVGWSGCTWIQGGPRMRVHNADKPEASPALNKIPLIKWQRNFHYRQSMHDAYPLMLNRAHSPGMVSTTGVIFHFKLVASLAEKAAEEMQRREHWAGGAEYERYLSGGFGEFYVPGISVRYEGPDQLIKLGLMSAGRWF